MALSNYLNASWRFKFSKKAEKNLDNLDQTVRARIVTYFEETILPQVNPRIKGKPLAGKLAGHWTYRVGDYRVLTQIKDNEMIILAVSIGHRREVYKT